MILPDITAQTIALWQELGPDGSRRNFVETDNTHFSQPGAGLVARMVARGLLAAGILAEQLVRRLDQNVPEDWYRFENA